MYKHRTPEDRLNSLRIREEINHALRNYYQTCMANELPPRLHEVLKQLDEQQPEPAH